ncbi:hypothetical protein G3I44_12185 [Halogeometricum borinquense]|uniref:Uncharacterized protein n=1 Tax=Halogeometricum borinquense TaxID=60847 RepID=A0A6C0UHK7_9EURY|nr:hypothetical protein [Halogeometricum borinquense]QIB74972.1 hypothetical protein G3I44_12185 [Halogeometricum borinquense]
MSNDTNDLGKPLDNNMTKGGFSRYTMASLLQKAVRRGDRERAMFASFELCRSGYSWNFWDRAATILLEDNRLAVSEASLLPAIERLRKLATKKWDPDEGMGIACAMRAASLLAEAESARELLPMKNWWLEIAEDRMQSLRRGEQPEHDFPVPPESKDLGELGFVVNDTHTAAGSRAGRNLAHYLIESSRTTEQSELGQQYQRLIMEHEISYDLTDEQIDHGTTPVSEDEPWEYNREIGFPRH